MKRYIIDTREPYEFADSHVDGALNLPPHVLMGDVLPEPLASAARDDEIILYCRTGMRSNTIGQILRMNGFSNVVNGINEHHVAKLLKDRG